MEHDPVSTHKATTFVRGTSGDQGQRKGYAASCTCGAVTFGGFESRTDAKAALEHTEGEVENPTWADDQKLRTCYPKLKDSEDHQEWDRRFH